MTKKKKQSDEEIKHYKTDYNTDNEHNRMQNNGDYIDSDNTDLEKTQGTEIDAASNKDDSEPIVITDKDVKPEVSVEEKLAEMQDRYLRLSAEFDNYRKRTLREKMDLTKYASENILIGIIPVMDDFERAIKLMQNASDGDAVRSGIDFIYNKFSEFLKQNGLKEIESLNKEFNVDVHEAVTKIPVQDESMKGKVVEVVVKGYYLHDKVIRHSKVVVGE